jgi:tetratricopeptide (TPR) repeat protein
MRGFGGRLDDPGLYLADSSSGIDNAAHRNEGKRMNYDAQRHALRGALMLMFRRNDAAIAAYRAALAADPDMLKALRSLAFLLAEDKHYAEAATLLARATKLVPTDTGTWFNLGFVEEKAGQRRAAIEAFRRAVALNPAMDRAWYGMGIAHAALGEHEDAAQALEEAATLQGMNGIAWYALGMAHHHCHRPDKVKEVAVHMARFDPQRAKKLIQETERADLMHLVAHLEQL